MESENVGWLETILESIRERWYLGGIWETALDKQTQHDNYKYQARYWEKHNTYN